MYLIDFRYQMQDLDMYLWAIQQTAAYFPH